MPSWDAISNYMTERQENRDMGQNDHVRIGEQGFVYTDRQPSTLSEDPTDEVSSPEIGVTEPILGKRKSPSLTQGPEDTWRDTARMGTLNFLQEQFGWDTYTARRFSEQLWGTSNELSSTAFGIGLADLIPITAAPLTMQEGVQQFSQGMETGSGTDMAIGGVLTAAGALESIPVIGAGFKMLNKAAQSEVVKEFIGVAGDAFNRTGEITQDALIEAGEAAQARLDSMMSGTTLSANPVGAAGDAIVAGAGKVASAMKPTEPAPVFYSAVANAVDALPMEKGSAQQMRAMIAKSPEVKAEEMAWIGLDDFLKGKKSVTKQEIKDFVDANQVQIEEVRLGEQKPFNADRLKELENEYYGLKEHAIDDPSFGEEKYNEMIQLMNIRDNSTTGSLYAEADDAMRSGQIAQRRGNNAEAEYHFRHHELLNTRAEKLDLEDLGPTQPTKFDPDSHPNLSLPGGKNYREVLLRLPSKTSVELRDDGKYWINNADGSSSAFGFNTREDAERLIRDVNANSPRESQHGEFTGGHYDESNVLAHMRLNDRTGPNGEKILFVEEIQSDWHQKGQKQGYQTPEITKKSEDIKRQQDDLIKKRTQLSSELSRDFNLGGTVLPDGNGVRYYSRDIIENNDYKNIGRVYENGTFHIDEGFSQANPEAAVKLKELAEISYETGYLEELRPKGSFVPDAPLKKTWHEMSFRRIARMAAEEGYDAIAWTPGKLQAERYDLSKQVSEINYDPDTKKLLAYEKDGYSPVISEVVSEDKLADYIGKEAAERLLATTRKTIPTDKGDTSQHILKGADLEVGGKFHKDLYDKKIKKYADKWGKKFGAKVGVTDLKGAAKNIENDDIHVISEVGNTWVGKLEDGGTITVSMDDFPDVADASEEMIRIKSSQNDAIGTQVWTMPVTKKMKDSVLSKGVATFGAAGVAVGMNQKEERPNGN